MPGSALHGTKLRVMQAVAILGGRWGEVTSLSPLLQEQSLSAPEWCRQPSCTDKGGLSVSSAWLYSAPEDIYIRNSTVRDSSADVFQSLRAFLTASAEPFQRGDSSREKKKQASRVGITRGLNSFEDLFPILPAALRGVTDPADLNEACSRNDVTVAAAVIAMLARYALGPVQLPSTRQYMEGCMLALARRFPEAALAVYIEPSLGDYSVRFPEWMF
jgi:hypothetical protein